MFGGDCTHDSFECRCYAAPRAATQGLDELEFVRSACHAAQVGNLEKLGRILSSKPEAVSWDGGTGAGTRHWRQAVVSLVLLAAAAADTVHPSQAALATHPCTMRRVRGR